MESVEGAGGLLLLAAVQATGLASTLTAAVHEAMPGTLQGWGGPHGARWLPQFPCFARFPRLLAATLQGLLLTLLFLTAVGLRRPWDLRSYTGDALGLLTGRPRAYGYRIVESFLLALAHMGVADRLTTALARWTATVWAPDPVPNPTNPAGLAAPMVVYIDGHRKPVYTNACIPRGLIGRTGKILGCRALTLLHDEWGHVLLATTHRGDQHLTVGIPSILATYEQANPHVHLAQVIVDREGMSATWLA